MSQPNIPNITPLVNLKRKDIINLLLSSIALEELALAHIINSVAEKIQFVLGTLDGQNLNTPPTFHQLIAINRSVDKTLQTVVTKEILLKFKFENVLELIEEEEDHDKFDDEPFIDEVY